MDSNQDNRLLWNAFENMCNSHGWGEPTEEFFNDFCAFMSNFEFEIIGIGSESEVGIQSVKARITKVVSDSNEEEKQGSKDTDKNA
mgnify:FL=1